MSKPAEKYVTHWDIATSPHWVTRLENGAYQSYHYTQEAADRNTAHLNELVKLRAAYAEMAAKIMLLRASEHALQSENAALLRNALKHMSEILPQPKPTDKEALASLTLDALSDWDWTEKKDERPEPYTTIAKQHGFAPVPDGVRDATLRQLQHKR